MPKVAKPSVDTEAHLQNSNDGDVLHFLSRTLQAHTLDTEPRTVLAKLQSLSDALIEQEQTLAGWPESASKERICAALAKAKRQVARILDECRKAKPAAVPNAKAS